MSARLGPIVLAGFSVIMSARLYWIAARSDSRIAAPNNQYTAAVRVALEHSGASDRFLVLIAASKPQDWEASLRDLEGKILGLAVIRPRSLSCVLEVLSDQSRADMEHWLMSKQYGKIKVS